MPGKLTDDDLAAKARRYLDLGAEISDRQEERDDLKRELLGELDGRGRLSETVAGVRVTKKGSSRSEYVVAKAKRHLPAKVARKVIRLVVDPKLLRAEVDAGHVDEATVAKFTERRPTASYPLVTLVDETKAA